MNISLYETILGEYVVMTKFVLPTYSPPNSNSVYSYSKNPIPSKLTPL